MRKTISLFVAIVMCLTSLTMFANAAENRIYLEDGSYYVITIAVNGERASGTRTGTKSYTYHTSAGVAKWTVKLTGTFAYSGNSATCTAFGCDVTVLDSNWNVISKSTSKSGNEALATVTMGRKVLGVTIEQKTANLSLSCDGNGNLS